MEPTHGSMIVLVGAAFLIAGGFFSAGMPQEGGPGVFSVASVPEQAGIQPESFVAAARRGDEQAVRTALESQPELVDSRDGLGLTALDWAATREHWSILRQLVAAGADVNVTGFDGGSSLHRLAHHDQPELMGLLLEAGADLNLRNQWGRTPLHVAARRGHVGVAEVLMAGGAELGATTREGWTPLHVAYGSGHPEMVEWLIGAGADERALDEDGRVPAEHILHRPPPWEEGVQDPWAYQGHYRVHDQFAFSVRVVDGQLTLRDFATVPLYPTGPDAFFTQSEPWGVRFVRDGRGNVTDLEVQFLRRAETGSKLDHPEYIGSERCGECHATGEGAPYVPWLRSRHASAYWRLATDWARILAAQRPHFQDLSDPRTDSRCLNCHTTAALDELALFARSFRLEEGVGCEACHGPGSTYSDPETMRNREAFLAAGGRIPDEDTCRGCHRNPATFSFQEWWPRIAHGGGG